MSPMKHFAMSVILCLSVDMCLKVSVNYIQPVGVFVFCCKKEWIYINFTIVFPKTSNLPVGRN